MLPTLFAVRRLPSLLLLATGLATLGCAQESNQPPISERAPASKQTTSTDQAVTPPSPTAEKVTSNKVSSQQAEAPPKKAASDGRPLDKTFDDIKFDIEPDAPFDREMLTDEIEALVDQKIRIRGYISPTARQRGIKQFVLVRDNQECCFGPGAALYDCILIEMAPGKSTEFSIRPVSVEGQFRIEIFEGPGGKPLAIYQMRGDSVER